MSIPVHGFYSRKLLGKVSKGKWCFLLNYHVWSISVDCT